MKKKKHQKREENGVGVYTPILTQREAMWFKPWGFRSCAIWWQLSCSDMIGLPDLPNDAMDCPGYEIFAQGAIPWVKTQFVYLWNKLSKLRIIWTNSRFLVKLFLWFITAYFFLLLIHIFLETQMLCFGLNLKP